MSSLKIKIFLCLSNTFDKSSISFFVYPAPVGLDGEFKISHFVFLDIAFYNFFAESLKPSFSSHFIILGVPPANKTISG